MRQKWTKLRKHLNIFSLFKPFTRAEKKRRVRLPFFAPEGFFTDRKIGQIYLIICFQFWFNSGVNFFLFPCKSVCHILFSNFFFILCGTISGSVIFKLNFLEIIPCRSSCGWKREMNKWTKNGLTHSLQNWSITRHVAHHHGRDSSNSSVTALSTTGISLRKAVNSCFPTVL